MPVDGLQTGLRSDINRHADLLFNIVSSRSQQRSTIDTTNRPLAEWGEAFPNAVCLVALVDRLVHNTEIIAIDGDSYRRKEAEEYQKARSAERCRRRSGKWTPGLSGCAGPSKARTGTTCSCVSETANHLKPTSAPSSEKIEYPSV